jgi:prepilin-type N-terminal cleavage/methylation domain-containing protein
MKNKSTPRSGFTLIELLTVIAIIGILAAILIPAVGQVKTVANKMKSSSNMRSISLAYATYSTSSGRTKILTDDKLDTVSVQGVAIFLAEKTDLTDSALWYIDSDDNTLGQSYPATIGYRNSSNKFEQNWSGNEPVSYDFALGVGGNDPTTSTPLLWTRGLDSDGVWGTDTPWGRGGHIAFLDAHVQFYQELDEDEDGALTNPTTGATTTNIEEVINTNAGSEKKILLAD